MPQIIITNLFNKTLKIDSKYSSLLKALQAQHLDWMYACGGKGRCTTCKAIVIEGMKNLSQLSDAEKSYRQRGLLAQNERLVCQVKLKGALVVAIPEENKFPHLEYSD